MDERLQQFDTAVFGPWRAVTAAFGQHMRNVATIQTQAGRAYLEIALHNLSSLNTAGRDALPPPRLSSYRRRHKPRRRCGSS